MLRLAPLIVRNVLRSKRRTLLSLASTAISLAILTFMVAMFQGFFYADDVSDAGALRMITRHKVALVQPLPASYMQQISKVDGVEEISAYSWFQGKYKDNKPAEQFARFSVDADRIFKVYPDFTMPAEQQTAFIKNRTGCAVARAIAKQLDIKVGDRMVIVGDIYPVTLELTVEAIFDHPKNTECMFFHREYLSELLPESGGQRDLVGTFIFRARSPQEMNAIGKEIDRQFANSSYPTRTESEKEFGASFLAFLGNLKLFMGIICAAVTFTIMLVSANSISMSVRERTRETAIMRTLGYGPGEIMQMIVGESVMVSVIGGLIGMGLGSLMLMGGGGGFPMQGLKWQGALVVLGVAIFVGVLAAAVPAAMTARKNVVESLRFTG